MNLLHAAVLGLTLLSAHSAPARQTPPAGENAPQARPLSDGYKLQPGPHAPASADFTLRDEQRAKDLPLKLRFPADLSRPAPAVIFSHGMGGSGDAFADLTAHWASHGYVVILPTHDDSARLRRQRGEAGADILQDLSTSTRSVDPAGRLADVKLILDSLDLIESAVPALRPADGARAIDRERLAVAGHSAGALTAQMAVGVKVRGRRMGADGLTPQDLGDRRLKAAIVISGQGTTNRALTADSWAHLDTPMLVFAGSLDVARVGNETPQSRRHPFELAKPGHKHLVYIEGATHGSYQGRSGVALLREEPTTDVDLITDTVAAASLAFLDAFLRDDPAARDYLASDALTRLGRGKVEYLRK